MKRVHIVLIVTILFLLSLVVFARVRQASVPQQSQSQVNQDRTEAAHGRLLSGEDKANH